MITSERAFWKKIKAELNSRKIGYQRFEDMLSEGIPDLCVFVGGSTVWIELKYKKLPKRPTTKIKVGLRPAQRVWLTKASRRGIESYVLTLLSDGNTVLHEAGNCAALYEGRCIKELYEIASASGSIKDAVDFIKNKSRNKGE